ncbi:MAG: hypothetical protein JJ899_00775 [Alphaproteobacteria bacterium]|nr:hypothetical protein [Alphaproteobacteria bacterium]
MRKRAGKIAVLVPEALLHAHVDVLLTPARRRAVESAIARDPDLAETVTAWRRQNRGLRKLAALHTPPPMSRDMRYAVQRLKDGRGLRPRNRSTWQIAAAIALMALGTCLWLAGADLSDPDRSGVVLTTSVPGAKPAPPSGVVEATAEGEPAVVRPIPREPAPELAPAKDSARDS